MKLILVCLGLLLLTGCHERDNAQSARRVEYPPLTESPPPPLPSMSKEARLLREEPASPIPVVGAVENSWMQRRVRKEEQLKSLRDYAARANPDDPFALTEEEIEALSKVDDLLIQ